jgi:hypothetical protein
MVNESILLIPMFRPTEGTKNLIIFIKLSDSKMCKCLILLVIPLNVSTTSHVTPGITGPQCSAETRSCEI